MNDGGSHAISLRWLADYVDGVLVGSRLSEVEAALSESETLARVEALRATIERIAEGPLDGPPSEVEAAAVGLFRAVHHDVVWPPPGVFLGELVFDHADELVGVRSGAETRRLLWTLPDFDVDASLVQTDLGVDLLGQFLALDPASAVELEGHVQLRDEDGRTHRAEVEPDGRFTFRGLARGLHRPSGHVLGHEFVLTPVLVG